MDVLVAGGPAWLSHLLHLRLSFEVSYEGPVGRCDHIIDALEGLSECLLEVLVDLGLRDESLDGRSVLVEGWD